MTGYNKSDWFGISLAAVTLIPFVLVRFFGFGSGSPVVAAGVIGLAIVAAAFFLSWAVEGLETGMPQAVALAVLALVEVAPEYVFEAILAFRQQVTLAAASMTGANRLLLGLGWPLIMFVAYVSSRWRGSAQREISLDERQSIPLVFLLLASAYAFIIVFKGSIALVDAVALTLIYGLYMYAALAAGSDEAEELQGGIGMHTKALPPVKRWTATLLFLAFGAVVLYFGAEPFLDAVLEIARKAGVSEFAVVQWLVPFLSEFPESLTAYLWAARVSTAGMGLSNLISSKLNQWTLLIATIPLAYSLGVGGPAALHLTEHSQEEVFLTAAQSLFGVALLLDLKFTLPRATVLLLGFVAQFVFVTEWTRTVIAWVYLGLVPGVVLYQWPRLRLFQDFRTTLGRKSAAGIHGPRHTV